MKRVVLESPYAGDIERNVAYARLCVRHSLLRGESPVCSHLLFTQEGILDDNDPIERKWGIDAGLAWKCVADLQVFYIDYGWSNGMLYGLEYAKEHNIPWETRTILTGDTTEQAHKVLENMIESAKAIRDMEAIDLRNCERGDVLVCRDGTILEYFDVTPYKHLRILDHVVRFVTRKDGIAFPPENFGVRTHDGCVLEDVSHPGDIIKIIKKNSK